MSRKNLLILTIALIVVIALCIGIQTKNKTITVFVEIENDNSFKSEVIRSWRDSNDKCYIFLPSYVSLDKISIWSEDNTTIKIEDVQLSEKTLEENLEFNCSYEFSFTQHGVQKKENFIFMQTGNTPSLFVDTESQTMNYINSQKNNEEAGELRLYSPTGELQTLAKIKSIHGRGNSSWDNYEKKPYIFELEEESDMLGLGAASKWVLIANAGDPSQIRNKFVYDFAQDYGLKYSPQAEWVDLYLNGAYAGLYLLSEKNEIHTNRIGIPIKSGVLVSKENSNHLIYKKKPYVVTESNSFFRIHSGDDKTQILNHLQSVENAITDENGIDAVTHKHFSEIIDVDSWVKKYLIEEVFGNIDAGHASQFYYWDTTDNKIYAGPVWDYDNALNGNTSNGLFANRYEVKSGVYSTWDYSICRNKDFKNHIIREYMEEFVPLLDKFLNENIQQYEVFLAQAAAMDAKRWPQYSGDIMQEIDVVKKFLQKRTSFLEDYFINEANYSTVRVDVGNSSNYLYFGVRNGAHFEELPKLNKQAQINWYYEGTNNQFSAEKPIEEDTYLVARWETGDPSVIRKVYELLPSLVLTFSFFLSFYRAFAELDKCGRKKNK